ncbi:uncharacterized protein Z520_01130 [Fonsecaea multimorphosa CBS 102226]|uniref:Glycine zipper 2TM domain-containing protein n=1 Tax=Fonsecaea multimorphosa CBS 102226 TaxID=1442371 RepID=A0A0D2KGR9_9EURO|nr:uncharacterized protein Z520_01130 [Fonsecaea multimorphosa CBS 102226]KIY02665.1 hypothetical protein Z520_01130 [Fonsecaea multimorphosa CBS 102226]OAL31527.1 hypothetical protein AYO22_01119 [Fonsecaea multimorphosa]
MSGSYDQYPAYSQTYDHNNQYYSQNSYPAEGFSGSYQPQAYHNPQSYYPDTRSSSYPDNAYQQGGSNTAYYNNNTNTNPQGPEEDRGLLGAAAGGAAGAFGGHKVGHGVLGALGGAILGSLTEDYAKKNKKHSNKPGKHNKHNHGYRDDGSYASSNNQNFASGGLGSVASSFFNKK